MDGMLVPLIGMLLIFYFILWRPQAKERRERETMLQALKAGDKVMTTSGMFGTIFSIKDSEVVLKVDDKNNIKIKFSRQAIQGLAGDPNLAKDTPAEKNSEVK